MKNKTISIRVGSRSSLLAIAQVQEIYDLLMGVEFEHQLFDTQGDIDLKSPLGNNLPDDFFTDTLDKAVLKGEIDVAIHSAKDLPQHLAPGLAIFALTKAEDEHDAYVGKVPLAKLKGGARVATSSPLREANLKKINPRVKAIAVRGNIQSRLIQLDSGKFDGLIVAACALKRLGLADRIKMICPWPATPLQGQLAVVGRSDDHELKDLFAPIDERKNYGTVYLVGAGPGDPELITLKAVNILKKAQVVFYDYLINKKLLGYARRAKKFYVGKRKGAHSMPQQELNQLIKDQAIAGKTVVRLKGGDPLIFGRGGDEIQYLKSFHIQVQLAAGVSSATAIPTELGIPLTARGISDSVAIVSGHSGEEEGGVGKLKIPQAKTLVFLMGLTRLAEIVKTLMAQGWSKDTPAAVVSRGTMSDERVIISDLKHIAATAQQAELAQPALIIVGETVRFYQERQNKARRILFTGTNPKQYSERGQLISWPMIHLKEKKLSSALQEDLLNALNSADLVLLTSRFGVEFFFRILKGRSINGGSLSGKKFVAIGEATARALRQEGIRPDLVSDDESSQGLFKAMKRKFTLKGLKVLHPRSALPNPTLKTALTAAGAKVKEFAVYENEKPSKRILPRKAIDEVIFTSPSTVNNFLKDYGTIPRRWKILSKGPLTAKTLKEKGFESDQL